MEKSKVKNTFKNLKLGLRLENKISKLYTKAAEVAKSEGLNDAAKFFRKAAKEEKAHVMEIEKIMHGFMD